MRFLMNVSLGLAAAALLALSPSGSAMAACKKMGFLVNDYGKDGPTEDAKRLLDDHIAKWAAEQGIKKYTTGKKDVSCELFLNLIVVDEHTCTASATVCWDEKGGTTAEAAKPAKKAKVENVKAESSKSETPAADSEAAAPTDNAAESAAAAAPAKPTETGAVPDTAKASAAAAATEPAAAAVASPSEAAEKDAALAAKEAAERAAAAAERAAAAAERAAQAAEERGITTSSAPAAAAGTHGPTETVVPPVAPLPAGSSGLTP